MQNDQTPPIQGDMNELNRRIGVAWDALNAVIAPLGEEQLSGPRDANGWAVKDHLIHLAFWERSIAGLLEGRPRHVGLGVSEQEYADLDVDAVNAIIFAQHRDRSVSDVLATLQSQHEATLNTLAGLTWDDVLRPYASYLPTGHTNASNDPVLYWIMGNTAGHYDEHREWIEELLHSDG